jgi:hypothetical protein
LFLLPKGRLRQRFARVVANEVAAEVLGLFLLPRGAATTALLNHCRAIQIDNASVSHGDGRTRIRGRNKKRHMRKEGDDVVAVLTVKE